jgi:hypothetical protein
MNAGGMSHAESVAPFHYPAFFPFQIVTWHRETIFMEKLPYADLCYTPKGRDVKACKNNGVTG